MDCGKQLISSSSKEDLTWIAELNFTLGYGQVQKMLITTAEPALCTPTEFLHLPLGCEAPL